MRFTRRNAADIFLLLISVAIATIIWKKYSPELAFSFLTIPIAFFTAKWYGDVAGGKAAREYEEEKAVQARIIALKSLLNQTAMARNLVGHNSGLPSIDVQRSPLKLPVTPFETAFLSSDSVLLERDSDSTSLLLDSVIGYLRQAYAINTYIEVYLNAGNPLYRESSIKQIKESCGMFLQVLDKLEGHLRDHFLQISNGR